ncbi:hypothetical protein EDM54_23825 [Brevibacillus borstelensis]|uniref:hypothetical protein n=1 Tax=Brevibacillus borstelensis TaxID=45462 RepID=UPI000F083DC6|nr:hypothetical protein [Brevibacillus borstelensis]MED1882370.1 hypothetical protein [Brevibacillus borstelensis]RNB56650.1 hypothetical protein EDM54_23825 [Brevibacillus borstelensis]GED55466.1 hypothetical protein BBO01nite_47070 [Brevibacillus borstelensis]
MVKVRDIMEYKRQKDKEPVSFLEHLERAKDRYRKPTPAKPAEVLTIGELRRLMGDVGPRRFLKDKSKTRK